MNYSKMRTNLPEVYLLRKLNSERVRTSAMLQWSATCRTGAEIVLFLSFELDDSIWRGSHRQLLVSTYLMTRRWFTSSRYKEINNFGRLVAPIYGKFGTLVRLALQNLTSISRTHSRAWMSKLSAIIAVAFDIIMLQYDLYLTMMTFISAKKEMFLSLSSSVCLSVSQLDNSICWRRILMIFFLIELFLTSNRELDFDADPDCHSDPGNFLDFYYCMIGLQSPSAPG